MRAEKLGIALQRFRKYSSSFRGETAGFVAEKRRRFSPFSAAVERRASEAIFVRRIWWDVSAGSVDFVICHPEPPEPWSAKRGSGAGR
jgi:hypothetical protein